MPRSCSRFCLNRKCWKFESRSKWLEIWDFPLEFRTPFSNFSMVTALIRKSWPASVFILIFAVWKQQRHQFDNNRNKLWYFALHTSVRNKTETKQNRVEMCSTKVNTSFVGNLSPLKIHVQCTPLTQSEMDVHFVCNTTHCWRLCRAVCTLAIIIIMWEKHFSTRMNFINEFYKVPA